MSIVGLQNEVNRNAWIERKLKEIPDGWHILDAGAGERRCKPYCAHLCYTSQDFGQYTGCGDKKGLQTGSWNQENLDIISDIAEIPRPDLFFDAIMCIEVFEHLPAPLLALKEFSRLLRPGGVLLLTAPFCSLTHFAPFHFSAGFNSYWYEKHLPEYGFKILELEKNGNYFEYLAQEIRRIDWVANKYTNCKANLFEHWIVKSLLKRLEKLSRRDTGSNEILYFGCHVLAIKE